MKINPSLYVEGCEPGMYKIMQYNVDQAMREERHPETAWNARKQYVKAMILDVDADIICLQEFRHLPGVPESPEQFLADVCGKTYRFVIDYRNAGPLSFGQAILYRVSKFYATGHGKKWLSDTPGICSDTCAIAGGTTGFGYIVNWVVLHPVREEKFVWSADPLVVFNTHFGLDEELKTKSCGWLRDIVAGYRESHCYCICGDFNFFPDRDGAKQRTLLTEAWQDLGKDAVYVGAAKTQEGTFIGYAHDEFKADLNNMVSRLDHIFACQEYVERVGQAQLIAKTMRPEIDDANDGKMDELRRYPSDHMPLVVNIRVIH